MNLPSKRLLSAVFDKSIRRASVEGSVVTCYTSDKTGLGTYLISTFELDGIRDDYDGFRINIYELMHKMKEWAVEDKGFMFSKLINFGAYTQYQVFIKQPSVEAEFMGTTEFEAMTKACEWILKEQNEK